MKNVFKVSMITIMLVLASISWAATNVSFSDVDMPHVERIELTRGSGTLINWRVLACVPPVSGSRDRECRLTSGTFDQSTSNSIRNIVRTVILPAFCVEHGWTCVP